MILQLILRRLGFLVFVLLGISLITFLLSHVVPADPIRLFAGPRAGKAAIAAIKHEYGFDLPIWQQYFRYIGGILHGDFGYSLTSHRSVSNDLVDYLPATVELTLSSIVLILIVGIPLGVISAIRRDSIFDHVGRALSITGVAMPAFWLGLMAQLILFADLGWLPAGERLDSNATPPGHFTGLYTIDSLLSGNLHLFGQSLVHLLLPAAVLGYGSLAVLTRQVRASMLEVMPLDYVRTARAKGLSRFSVIVRHALRNALLPATTVMGLQIGFLLGGALLVEDVFAWPGIGRYATLATTTLDYNAVMGVTIVAAAIYVVVNLLVDVLYMVLDPRISY
jgi:peptide/nickel transport system permease protein